MERLIERLIDYHCPRWDELPDMELYIDQVVTYVEKHVGIFDVPGEGNLITASMINNYVKMKLIPPPEKRRYTQRHLARLIVICTLKRDFSISELRDMTELTLERYSRDRAYNLFCQELERALRRVFGHETAHPEPDEEHTSEFETIQAVMTAFANKVYAQCVIKAYWAQKAQEAQI